MRQLLLCAAALAAWPLGAARADDNPVLQPVQALGDLGDLLHRDALIAGDTFGLRKDLEDRGIVVGIDEIAEAQGNVSGGTREGTAVDGRLELFANVDMDQLVGWKAIVHINAYQIHGQGLSSMNLGNLLTVSNIEASPSFRLFTLWVEQSLFDDRVSVRAGQIAADDEFFVSQYASLFVNSAFGWPSLLGTDLPSGGPAYPLATPGIRARVAVSPSLVLTGAILNGDPAPAGPGDPQRRDPDGLRFRTDGGALMIGEAAYSYTIGDANLPGTVKLGAWYHTGDFANQRFDTAGHSLASPLSNGVAQTLDGDYGGHLIIDQMLWRFGGSGDQGLDAFARIGVGPSDRNLVQLHADGGVTYTGLVPGRDSDVVGLGFSYERVGDARRALSRDLRAVAGPGVALADYESVIELSYQAPVAPWLIVQPDVQMVVHPGARLEDVGAPVTRAPGDALIFGLRTALSF